MSHMLATVNKEAADAIGHEHDAAPDVPGIGETVVFHPRMGEWRAGRNKFGAIVTWVHDDGTLDLVVFYDADDFIGQRAVPRRDGEGRGWEKPNGALLGMAAPSGQPVAIMDLRREVSLLGEQVFGPCVAGKPSILETLMDMTARLTALENRPKPGRPKKSVPQV